MRKRVTIRPEKPADYEAVIQLNDTAFGQPNEGALVRVLREEAFPAVSLVAVADATIVGHILFTPVTAEEAPAGLALLMGLAPMAVLPDLQNQGIGSRLVQAGLKACTAIGCGAVVVLGHPEYYPRFGFVPASRFGIRCAYDVPDEVFMVVELAPDALAHCTGLVKYHPAFAEVTDP